MGKRKTYLRARNEHVNAIVIKDINYRLFLTNTLYICLTFKQKIVIPEAILLIPEC